MTAAVKVPRYIEPNNMERDVLKVDLARRNKQKEKFRLIIGKINKGWTKDICKKTIFIQFICKQHLLDFDLPPTIVFITVVSLLKELFLPEAKC